MLTADIGAITKRFSPLIWADPGSGLDLHGGDLRVLVGRLAAMYAMVLCVSLMTRFERNKRQTALRSGPLDDVVVGR